MYKILRIIDKNVLQKLMIVQYKNLNCLKIKKYMPTDIYLKKLYLDNFSNNDMIDFLRDNNFMCEYIMFNHCKFNNESIDYLDNIIMSNKNLKKIYFKLCQFSDFEKIIDVLIKNNIEYIKIEINLSQQVINCLEKFIKYNITIKNLAIIIPTIQTSIIGESIDFSIFFSALKNNNTITHFMMDCSEINNIDHIIDIIENNYVLKVFNLYNYQYINFSRIHYLALVKAFEKNYCILRTNICNCTNMYLESNDEKNYFKTKMHMFCLRNNLLYRESRFKKIKKIVSSHY